MKREIEKNLFQWKDRASRSPLIIRGPRQVGKTFVVKQFAKNHFEHFISINFEEEPYFSDCL